MNKNLLKSYIVKYDGTQANLAKAMNMTASRVSAKINENYGSFTIKEMDFLRKRYHLEDSEFVSIFFAD